MFGLEVSILGEEVTEKSHLLKKIVGEFTVSSARVCLHQKVQLKHTLPPLPPPRPLLDGDKHA